MVEFFHQSVMDSAGFFAVFCWESRFGVSDVNRLNKLIKKASSVISSNLETFTVLAERTPLSRLLFIMDNCPLYHQLDGRGE